jgi:hypothetical protein
VPRIDVLGLDDLGLDRPLRHGALPSASLRSANARR